MNMLWSTRTWSTRIMVRYGGSRSMAEAATVTNMAMTSVRQWGRQKDHRRRNVRRCASRLDQSGTGSSATGSV